MAGSLIVIRARIMRQNATSAERILWSRLRNRQLGGCKFYRQRPLHGYIADFYNRDAMLVIEIDGECHESTAAAERDNNRDVELQARGYRTLRIRNAEVLTNIDEVCIRILDVVYQRIEEFRRTNDSETRTSHNSLR